MEERETPIYYGGEKVGYLRITSLPNSDKSKIELVVILPEDAAMELFAEIESLIEEMKGTW